MGDRAPLVPADQPSDRLARPARLRAADATPSPLRSSAILAADDGLAEELGDISVPTLVVVGNQDILTPRRRQRGALRADPDG